MKYTTIIFLLLPLSVFCQVSEDTFDSGINADLWKITASPQGMSDIALVDGVLNFTHTGVGDSWGTNIQLEYRTRIPQTTDFSITVELENNDFTEYVSYTLVGMSIEVPEKGRKIWFDYLSDSWVRMINEMDINASGSESLSEGGPLLSPGNSYLFSLNYDRIAKVVTYTASLPNSDVFSGSVGISQSEGTLGAVDWDLDETDTFAIKLYSYAGARDASIGTLKMDNFSLAVIPEPSHISFIMGLSVILGCWLFRTSRWR